MERSNPAEHSSSGAKPSSFIRLPRTADAAGARASPLSIGRCATLACLLEASAPKPGNVHPAASFVDLTYFDFLASAPVIAISMEAAAAGSRLGPVVLEAIRATQAAVGTNTNLGIVLLIAPLAKVPRDTPLTEGVCDVLAALDQEDARMVYEAILAAHPGGLGRVVESDIAGPPPVDLLAAMRLAAPRDLVARQYVNGYEQVLQQVMPWLQEGLRGGGSLDDTIVQVQLKLMSQEPDSLIHRKCGREVALESASRAAAVLESGRPGERHYLAALAALDRWLRADGHRRNPGTTADLIAAGLFAALREGLLEYDERS